MKRRRLFILIGLLGLVALVIAVTGLLIVQFLIIPGTIQPAGTGVPQITSQFGDIKTRAKSPTPADQSAGNIQLVSFRQSPRRDSAAQAPYTSCTKERSSTATPTLSEIPSTVSADAAPTPLPTLEPATNAEPDFIVLRISSQESEACYQVGEVFFDRNNIFVVAVGVTKAINGEIAIDRAHLANSRVGEVVVDISQLRSDERNRDGAIRREWLESNRYPLARLITSRIVGLPARPYRDGEELSFQIISTLEIRKVQREVVFHTTASLRGDTLVATAFADIKMTDFGFEPPNLFGSLKANDEVRIVLNLVAREPKADAQAQSTPSVTQAATTAPTIAATMSATGAVTMAATSGPTPTPCRPSGRGGTFTEPIDPAPERTSVGTGHVLTGVVLSSLDCKPIAGARIILWLANPQGQYDDDHRATVYTDRNGEYRFESNFPGIYGGARPHIHLYVVADGYRGLETEYLPQPGQTQGTFDMVLSPQPTPTPTVTSQATSEGTQAG